MDIRLLSMLLLESGLAANTSYACTYTRLSLSLLQTESTVTNGATLLLRVRASTIVLVKDDANDERPRFIFTTIEGEPSIITREKKNRFRLLWE